MVIAKAAFSNDLADLADDLIKMSLRTNLGFIFSHTDPVHKLLCTANSMKSTCYRDYYSDLNYSLQFGKGFVAQNRA
jgi:hypothetical protein